MPGRTHYVRTHYMLARLVYNANELEPCMQIQQQEDGLVLQ